MLGSEHCSMDHGPWLRESPAEFRFPSPSSSRAQLSNPSINCPLFLLPMPSHFNAIFSGNHTLVKKLLERLVKINGADIAQELGVETGIQEVKHRMLHAADIHVYRKQGIRLLSGYQLLIIVIIHIAQEIPG